MSKNMILTGTAILALICIFGVRLACISCGDNDPTDVEVTTQPTHTPTPTPSQPPSTTETAPPTLIHSALGAALAGFPTYTTNNAPLLPRGTGRENVLRVGVGATGAFPGLFLRTHSEEGIDRSFDELANPPIVSFDERNFITNNGVVTFEFDREANAVVLNMQRDVRWHDGVELTLDDLVFAYEVIAHEDYTGVRFDPTNFIPNVRGVAEFRAGEAETICGLVLSNNNRTLRIYYNEPMPPAVLYVGGVWLNPIPRHYIEPVIAEVGHAGIAAHPRARHELLGFGPFKLNTVVTGESVYFTANDDYWQGAPLVDGVLVELLAFSMLPAAMRAGNFDIAAYQTVNFAEFELTAPTNYRLYAWPATSVTFLNFRLGKMDENGVVAPRGDNHPIENVAIRRAMAHAIDRQTLADVVGQGLWVPAPSVLHPFNASEYLDFSHEGFTFDLDLANQILDDAGFTSRDEYGYRLNLNGESMRFTYGQHLNPTHAVLVPLNIQNWRQIGLRVEKYNDDFLDWNYFTDIVFDDEVGGIDIFAMGWTMGANPAPHGIWGNASGLNMPRYSSPTFEEILAQINSSAAWDAEFLTSAYRRWERAFHDEVPAIPLTWNIDLVAVNNRVANFSRVRVDSGLNKPGNMTSTSWASHLVGLTAPVPYAD
ncbi:MAG: ABC transporter substrate-binding protein [Defluviitaleaceae bacterium]|nr:ABC transporter substrate-binding protein [Defluviitaleaceae bacterium]